MKKLHLTHRVEELCMGLFLLQSGVISAYWAFEISHWFLRLILVELAFACPALAYVFLFRMRGSQVRREAAEKKEG